MRKLVMIVAGAAVLVAPVCVRGAPVKLWQKTIGSTEYFRPQDGATLADLDEDGKDEVLVASTDGRLYVWRCDGSAYPGFPKQVHEGGIWFQSTPAVGDLDGDGDVEVVIGARGMSSGGALYAWHHDGKDVSGFPVTPMYVGYTVALEDLDDDDAHEIIVADSSSRKIYVFNGAGRERTGWPKDVPGVRGETAVGDIDGDGEPEIVLPGTNNAGRSTLYAWNGDGSAVTGFPVVVSNNPMEYFAVVRDAAALADLDKDGRAEIAIGTAAYSPDRSHFFVFRGDGTLAPGWPLDTGYALFFGTPSAADINNDGYLEIVACDDHSSGSRVYVWKYDGSAVPGFPRIHTGTVGNPAVADIDGDGRFEIVMDCHYWNGFPGSETVVAYNHDGSIVAGFPFSPLDNAKGNSVAIWDIDGDNALEMVVVSQNELNAYVEVYRLGGDAESPVWPMHNHDCRHTSCYDPDPITDAKVEYFSARAEGKAVLVSWATSSEWDHAGFNLYRGSADAAKAKLNAELITGRTPYHYLDRGVESGVEYGYWLEAVPLSGAKETYGPVSCLAGSNEKASFALSQNAPNPARNSTTVAFSVPTACEAKVTVYDIAGRKVAAPFAGAAVAGVNEISVDVSALAPGVYTYRLEAGGEAASRKMVVTR